MNDQKSKLVIITPLTVFFYYIGFLIVFLYKFITSYICIKKRIDMKAVYRPSYQYAVTSYIIEQIQKSGRSLAHHTEQTDHLTKNLHIVHNDRIHRRVLRL